MESNIFKALLTGQYVNAMGGKYHRECFGCFICGVSVAGRFIAHAGKPYCDECHEKEVAAGAYTRSLFSST
jgi:hypothetical protein